MRKNILFLFALAFSFSLPANAGTSSPIPELGFGSNGVVIKHDPSDFEMAIRFRAQSRFTYEDFDSPSKEDVLDFMVRRMRLRFDGSAFHEKFLYKIQLSFTRGDMDFETIGYPNILRDAVVGWKLTDKSTFWFGQTKLPGNRQRVTSSGSQELVDRSLLNATFNIDRDMGLQWYNQFGDSRPFWLKLAISNGEGRSRNNENKFLAYTGRVEWLPLGNFEEGGDYFEGDLTYEKTPKISVGAVYSYNAGTGRLGGQTGALIDDESGSVITRNIQTMFADFLLKYRGWAFSTEFAKRDANDPVVPISATANGAIYKGEGVSAQLSYNFANKFAPVIRYTRLFPDDEILSVLNAKTQYSIGLTKYLNRHQVKILSDLTLEQERNSLSNASFDNVIFRLQLEYGI